MYDPSKSPTAKAVGQPFSILYGDNSSVGGMQYTDTITLAGFTATGQTLGSATKFSTNFQRLSSDGICGLGFPENLSFGTTPLFQTLLDGGQLPEPVFAFYLNDFASELFVGGTNPEHYHGNFTHVPVTTTGYWSTGADRVKLNGHRILNNIDVILDSGSSLILANTSIANYIYGKIPDSKLVNGSWTYPCDQDVNISFTFGGTEFTVLPSVFNYGRVSPSSKICQGGIGSIGDEFDGLILGDVFMRSVYTKFDYAHKKIGFAQLRHNPS